VFNELKLHIDNSCWLYVVVKQDSHRFRLLLFGRLQHDIKIHHAKADERIRSLVGIPEFQLKVSAIFLVATVDKKVKGFIKDGFLTSFGHNFTGDSLVGHFDFKVGIHGKE
jgi:hypothetical protein